MVTSSGLTYINPGTVNQYFIRMLRNPDGTYPPSTTINDFSIGETVIRLPLPEYKYKIDYTYSIRVTGENISL